MDSLDDKMYTGIYVLLIIAIFSTRKVC